MNNVPFFVVRKEMYFLRPFSVYVTRTPEVITVKYARDLARGNDKYSFVVNSFQLELEKLRQRVDWKDYTQFGMHFKQYDVDYMLACARLIDQSFMGGMDPDDVMVAVEQQYPRFGTVNRNGYLINISAYLQNGRVSSLEGHALIPAYRMLNFTAKFKDTTFDDMMVSMNIDPKCPFEINEPENKIYEVINSMEIYRHLQTVDPVVHDLVKRPRLKITPISTQTEYDALAKEGYMPEKPCSAYYFKCQLVWEWDETPIEHEAEVYLEEVVGLLPKKRIYLDKKGIGCFHVLRDGLTPGFDKIRVKAGFRFQSGIADIEVGIEGTTKEEDEILRGLFGPLL